MTRREATETLYKIINSGIMSDEIDEALEEIATCICVDSFDKCNVDERCESGYPNYCEGCEHLEE